MSMPDFIVIGAMKSATSTLHEQLARQPGIFMSVPKEPNFFSDDEVFGRGLDWYRSLFAAAPPGSLRGESSTHYTKRPTHPRATERMHRHLTDVRLIYVMRDPLDRLVSHYIHEWTQAVISAPLDRAIDLHPELIDYGRYAMQLDPYLEAYGPDAILPVFAERLRDRPQEELERIGRFLGSEGKLAWHPELSDRNASATRLRKSAWRDAVVEAPVLRTIRRRLVPRFVRDRVKRFWTLRRRPAISPGRQARLREVFDADLARLGDWLGVELDCGNFQEVIRSRPLDWAVAARDGTR